MKLLSILLFLFLIHCLTSSPCVHFGCFYLYCPPSLSVSVLALLISLSISPTLSSSLSLSHSLLLSLTLSLFLTLFLSLVLSLALSYSLSLALYLFLSLSNLLSLYISPSVFSFWSHQFLSIYLSFYLLALFLPKMTHIPWVIVVEMKKQMAKTKSTTE